MTTDPYLAAADCVAKFCQGKGGLRTLCYNCRANPRIVFPLATKALENWAAVGPVIRRLGITVEREGEPAGGPEGDGEGGGGGEREADTSGGSVDKPTDTPMALLAILLAEVRTGHPLPDKRRRLERKTRAAVRAVKAQLEAVVAMLNAPGEAREGEASAASQAVSHAASQAAGSPPGDFQRQGHFSAKYLRVNRAAGVWADAVLRELRDKHGIPAEADPLLLDFLSVPHAFSSASSIFGLSTFTSGDAIWQTRASGLTVLAVLERIRQVEPEAASRLQLGPRPPGCAEGEAPGRIPPAQVPLLPHTVLDVCAAPGSKTLHAAAYFRSVTANDRAPRRARVLEKRVQEHHLEGRVSVSMRDAFEILGELDGSSCPDKAPAKAKHRYTEPHRHRGSSAAAPPLFDVIIVDPTCSGSGLYFNQDHAMADAVGVARESAGPEAFSRFQTEILWSALLHNAETPASGPRVARKYVVYSTCSVNREEDEDVVEKVTERLRAHYEAHPVPEGQRWRLARALPSWPVRGLGKFGACVRSDATMDTDGFFVALFERQASR